MRVISRNSLVLRTFTLFVMVSVPTVAQYQTQADVREEVIGTVEDILATKPGYYERRTALMRQSEQQLATAIVDLLRQNPVFQDLGHRRIAFRMLNQIRGEKLPIAYEQFVAGINSSDLTIKGLCLDALARVITDHTKELLPLFTEQWQKIDVHSLCRIPLDRTKSDQLFIAKSLIRGFGSVGSRGQPLLKRIEQCFTDAKISCTKTGFDRELNMTDAAKAAMNTLRVNAAGAMVQIGGIEYGLKYLSEHKLDAVGEQMIVGAIVGAAKMAEENDITPKIRKEILMLMLRRMSSHDYSVRKQALQSLIWFLWDKVDVVIIRSRHDYEWNPLFIDALEKMGANDPDEELRQEAERFLVRIRSDWGVKDLDRSVESIFQQSPTQENNGILEKKTP